MSTSNYLSAFKQAWRVLLLSGEDTAKNLLQDSLPLQRIFHIMNSTRPSARIHMVGMGRSGKVANIFSEGLKDLGFNISMIGKTLAKPIDQNDAVVAFSGSGWTHTTTYAAETALKLGATLVAFSGNQKSLLARIADCCILIPSSKTLFPKSSYLKRQIKGQVAPLTPMGTMFELTTLFVTSCIVGGLGHPDNLQGFQETMSTIHSSVHESLERLEELDVLESFIELLKSYCIGRDYSNNSVYCVGSGISSIVAAMIAIRLGHLGMNVQSTYDWRFRKPNDLLICISGSGETTLSRRYQELAKELNIRSIGITSWSGSSLAKETTLSIQIKGRKERSSGFEKPIDTIRCIIPAFEYGVAIFLDAVVAQIAADLNITEGAMKERHANVE
ncbi:MAG: SIS domain-containing protein [Candidatus Hodarchaeota archaeon]